MSTSGLIMIFAKEGKKPIGFLKWPGASEEEFTLDMSDQSITPARVMTRKLATKATAQLSILRTTAKLFQATSLKGQGRQGLRRKVWGSAQKALLLILWWRQGPHYKNIPGHYSEAKGDCRSRGATESAEAGLTYYFMLFSLPEYVGNQPMASVASASHSQASWA
jgi:hypothetical protein